MLRDDPWFGCYNVLVPKKHYQIVVGKPSFKLTDLQNEQVLEKLTLAAIEAQVNVMIMAVKTIKIKRL